jgi:peroxiredoxin
VKLGSPVADFTLQDLQGKNVTLSELKGKVVLLHFWSAKCPFVVRYESRLDAITTDYSQKGVVVYGIDSNITEDAEQVKVESKKRNLKYPILLDPDQSVADQFGAITTPHVYILDQEGVLRYEGAADDQGYGEKDPVKVNYARKALDAVLAGKPVETPESRTVGCTVKRKK